MISHSSVHDQSVHEIQNNVDTVAVYMVTISLILKAVPFNLQFII